MQYVRSIRPLGISDTKDCSVQALANALGIPYEESHKIYKDAGRKDMHGAKAAVWSSVWRRYGQIIFTGNAPPTIAQFVRANPTGSFLVGVNGHALAVVDGVVIDNRKTSPRWRVKEYAKVR